MRFLATFFVFGVTNYLASRITGGNEDTLGWIGFIAAIVVAVMFWRWFGSRFDRNRAATTGPVPATRGGTATRAERVGDDPGGGRGNARLFDRVGGGERTRIVEDESGLGKRQVDSRGRSVFTEAQKTSLLLVHEIRDAMGAREAGMPYGPGNQLEGDLDLLGRFALNQSAVNRIDETLMVMHGNFIKVGRYTKHELLELMGIPSDPSSRVSIDDDLQVFNRFFFDLFEQAVGLGGSGGDAVARYESDPDVRRWVAAWAAHAHARLDQAGIATLPSRDALDR